MTIQKCRSKTCSRCGEAKSADQFQKRNASADGMTAACKACLANYDARRYQESPVRRAHAKACALSPAGAEAKKRWAERNPEKRAAHIALGNAVRDGKVRKPRSCERCGKRGRISGHHQDYSKPLSVIWLCPPCHRKEHQDAA